MLDEAAALKTILTDEQLEERVNDILFDFDVDKNGSLGFTEFVKMLGQYPHSVLLPKSFHDRSHELVELATKIALVEETEVTVDDIESFLHIVRTLFATLDTTSLGRLAPEDIRAMIHKASLKHGLHIKEKDVEEQLELMIRCFDTEGKRSLSFSDLLRMRGYAPMVSWLPYEMRCRMPALARAHPAR